MKYFAFRRGNVFKINFERSIKNEIKIDDVLENVDDQVVNKIKENVGTSFRVWDVNTSPNMRHYWDKMEKGDIVFFIVNSEIVCKCDIVYKINNAQLGKNIWESENNNNECLLFFMNNYIEYNPPKKVNISGRWLKILKDKELSDVISLLNTNSLTVLIEKTMKNHKQIVLTGAPGTGKTYSANKYVNEKGESEFVQFHPSYDYADFVEGLRPAVLTKNGEPTFVKLDGVFKAFCRSIVEKNLIVAKTININVNTINDLYSLFDDYNKLKDKEDDELNDTQKVIKEKVDKYEENIKDEKYYFIIDEINRADLSKVFGELMYGLEDSYRGAANRFKTQYNYLPTYKIDSNKIATPIGEDVFEDGFFIPENLYIIGTMNDIDKSVEAFDFALRRRFEWIEIKANDVMQSGLEGMYPGKDVVDLSNRIKAMNEFISNNEYKLGLTEAYHIGHAYFKNLDFTNLNDSLTTLFDTNITSILKEYTRGNRNIENVNKLIKKCGEILKGNLNNP